jgi:hypothetical protein
MSLLHTESFMAFAQWSGDDAYSPANTTMRNGYMAALKRAGYNALNSGQDINSRSGSFVIRPDPVYPDRAALVYSSGNTTNSNGGVAYNFGAAVRKPLVSQGKPVIGGFSLYVPPEFVPNAYTVSTNPILYVFGGILSDTSLAPTAATALFIINSDLSVSTFGQARQSTKVLVPGRLAYIEYRFTDNEVRVWIDDVLVLQSAVSVPNESIGIAIYQNNMTAPGSFMQGAAGRWAISNWYNLTEDAQAPNVRLGPTTRVIGARPNNDVAATFVRPIDATSNAQVAGQDLVDQPVMSLQSSNVGDMDIYSTNKDTATSSGKLIHAVATKVLASNLESAPHMLRPLIVSAGGVEKEDPRPKEFRQLTSPFGTRSMYGVARRPTDGKVFASGVGPSIFATGIAGDANAQWTQIMDEGANTLNGIAFVGFRSDGTGIVTRRDYKMQIIAPGSDIPGPTFAAPATVTYIPNGILVLPDNTIIIFCTGGRVFRCPGDKDPAVIANWTVIVAVPGGQDLMGMLYHPVLKRLVAPMGATGNVTTSDDNGLTWTSRATSVGSNFTSTVGQSQLSFDGNWFTIVSQNTTTANYIRRSQDGISWTSPVYNTNGSSQSVIAFMFADAVTGVTLAMTGTSTAISSNDGGANWHRLTTFPAQLLGACALPNGDWFMVGTNGLLMGYTSALIDAPLTPLAGYQATFNASTTNPDTGAAWTPAEAAAAKFGMRVTA